MAGIGGKKNGSVTYEAVASAETVTESETARSENDVRKSRRSIAARWKSMNNIDRRRIIRDTFDDLTLLPYRRIFKRFFTHFVPLATIGVLLYLVQWVARSSTNEYVSYNINARCMPDATFSLEQINYQPYKFSSIFTIDLLTNGEYEFSTAKLIDTVWDLVAGRGGQLIMALISYYVFNASITRLMEISTLPYEDFQAIALQDSALTTTSVLLTGIVRTKLTRRAILILSWMVFSTIILLSFSTLATAMTGYTAAVSPYVRLGNGNMIAVGYFEKVQYVIHDADRLGGNFTSDQIITIPVTPQIDDYGYSLTSLSYSASDKYLGSCAQLSPGRINASLSGVYSSYSTHSHDPSEPYKEWEYSDAAFPIINNSYVDINQSTQHPPAIIARWDLVPRSDEHYEQCNLLWRVSEYVAQYGLNGYNKTSSMFMNRTLTQPVLNISAYYSFWDLQSKAEFFDMARQRNSTPHWAVTPYGAFLEDPVTGNYSFAESTFTYAYENTVLDYADFLQRTSCRASASSDTIVYQWGFSTITLTIFLALLFLWVVGNYILYLDAYFNSRLHVLGRRIGCERAALDLVATMMVEKPQIAADRELDTNSSIQKLVRGTHVSYINLLLSHESSSVSIPDSRWTSVRNWYRLFDWAKWRFAERWWLFALFIWIPISLPTYFKPVKTVSYPFNCIGAALVTVGFIVVFIMGRRSRCRWLFFVLFFLGSVVYSIHARVVYSDE